MVMQRISQGTTARRGKKHPTWKRKIGEIYVHWLATASSRRKKITKTTKGTICANNNNLPLPIIAYDCTTDVYCSSNINYVLYRGFFVFVIVGFLFLFPANPPSGLDWHGLNVKGHTYMQ